MISFLEIARTPIFPADKIVQIMNLRRQVQIRQICHVLEEGWKHRPALEQFSDEELDRVWHDVVGKSVEEAGI